MEDDIEDDEVVKRGDPSCPHEKWRVSGVTPDDLYYECVACKREVVGA